MYRHLPRGSEREEGTKPWDGLLVEIQYRTRAQHAYTSACVEPAARHHAPMSTARHYDHPPRAQLVLRALGRSGLGRFLHG